MGWEQVGVSTDGELLLTGLCVFSVRKRQRRLPRQTERGSPSLSLSFGISKGRHFLDWRDSREGGRLLEGEELWLRGHFTVGTSSTTQKGGEAYFWELSNKRREERRFYSNGQAIKAEKRGEMAREFEMRLMVKERQICRGKTIIVWTDKRQGMVLVGATLKTIN